DEQIDVTVVVVVAGADRLSPAGCREAGFAGHVGERAVVVIPVQVAHRGGLSVRRLQACAVDQKNIRPPVVVVIEDGDAAARCLEDVLLAALAADDRARGETGRGGDVAKVGEWITYSGGLKC